MTKKLFSILFLVFFVLPALLTAQVQTDAKNSELELYNELTIFSNANYYPGILEKAELLEKEYPQSVFIINARILKGRALIAMNRFEEAQENFSNVLSSLRFGAEQYSECWYYLALACYYDGDYTSALSAFHTVCDVELRENKKQFYHSAILYSSRIQFFMEQYELAIPLLEYVAGQGNFFTRAEYDEALQKLLFAYNNCGRYKDSIWLYGQLNSEDFSRQVYAALTIYAADAYEKTGQVEKAYRTLEENKNPDFTEMLCSFRLNLGAAAYSKKDYKNALSYFALAKESKLPSTVYTAFIYEEKIKLDQQGKAAALQVEKELLQEEAAILDLEEQVTGLTDSFHSLLLRTRAFEKDSQAALSYYSKLKNPSAQDAYIASMLLKESNPAEALQLLEAFTSDKSCALLYAVLLSQNGHYEKAADFFAGLEKNKRLDDETRMEYAKTLYRLKRWDEARSLALKTKAPLRLYLAGLCSYNLLDYKSAYSQLSEYSLSKSAAADYKMMADFYRGVSAYKNSAYDDSYKILSAFAPSYKGALTYSYRAYELAAKSALMKGLLKNAASMAQGMIQTAPGQKEKEESIIYCAEIYSDCKEYDKAIQILSAYTKEKSDFAVRCISELAKVYEKQGQLDKADKEYELIQRDYKGSPAAEEAAYRAGEIFYSSADYPQAEARFTKYIYNYVDGKYTDAAYYFSADCNMKTGAIDKAIMQNKTLVSKYPDSIYAYGAYKNLLQAYYQQENFTEALAAARLIIRSYKEQASADNIGQRIVELERIVGGTDRVLVEKIGEYERAGKTSTKKGRNTGSELVLLYAQKDLMEEAFNLAMELLDYQKESDEMYNAAQNADLIAAYYFNSGNSKKAAEYYLKAAEYYRSSSQDSQDKAASALYSAVDAFIAAGLRGDAEVTAKLLIELYPRTKQGQKVMNLLN